MAKGRKSSVRYYASKGGYFTHFEGKNIRLADGPDDAPKGKIYLAALDRFRELMQVNQADTADQSNTVRVVVDLDGQHLERNGQHGSLKILLQTLTSGVAEFGDKTFSALKPVHITNWLAKMAKPRDHTHKTRAGGQAKTRAVKWGPTYQNIALRTLVAAFNWGKGQGLISSHCLQNSKAVTIRGRKRSRGQEAYITPRDVEDHDRLRREEQPRIRRHPAIPPWYRMPPSRGIQRRGEVLSCSEQVHHLPRPTETSQ